MIISKYVAQVQLQFDKKSIANVDKQFKVLENKLKKFGKLGRRRFSLDIFNFVVDQRRLNVTLSNALDIASARTVFQVSRFSVDQGHLNRTMAAAMRQATNLANQNNRLRPNVTMPRNVQGNGTNRTARSAGVGGAIGGGLSRLYGPAVALGLGGYGLGALNQRNQQVVSAQLQSSAVVQQAGGTAEQGAASFDWLRNQANRIGFNYLDASGDYNKLLSGLTGAGMSVEQGQDIFKGFSELARVNKLDRTQQQRVYRALSQVAGKNKLQSEELVGQLAESLPGAVPLFAKAYQDQIGGNKTGQEAITELLDAMKKGKVKGDILKFAGARASAQAQPGLSAASQASQAEQARYQNTVNDMAVLASKSGVEEGFARIFRTLNAGLSESGSLVRGLANGFNEATKWADDLLLWPQSFARALEGKDSLVADWLGIESTKQLREDWESIKQSFTDLFSLQAPSWLPTLESTTKELAAIMRLIAAGSQVAKGNLPTETATNTGTFADIVSSGTNNFFVNAGRARERAQAVYGDPTSPYYQDAAGYDAQQRDMAMAAAQDKAAGIVENKFSFGDITITVPIDAIQGQTVEEQGARLADYFKAQLEETMAQFPVKE